MKRFFLVVAVLGIIMCSGIVFLAFYAEDNAIEAYAALPTSIRIENDTMNLGTVKYGEKRQLSFRVTNTGEHPLFIHDVKPSCGCTGVDWKKHPIAPEKSVDVRVVFEPTSLGHFRKSIDVLCNTALHVHQVYLKGEVVE